jgi:hypothetical protein
MLPHAVVALRNAAPDASERYRLCTNVQAVDPATQRAARFVDKAARQMRLYAAIAFRGADARLTAFRSARNIIRIRTNGQGCGHVAVIAASNEQACS